MTLYTASTQPTVLKAAVAYFYEGMSVLPLTGKKSLRKWEERQQACAIPDTIHYWARSGALQNVGIVCGQVSHNLVVIDLDGQAAIDAFEHTFPFLLDTFTVLTGGGKGKHLYYRVAGLPSTTLLRYPNHQAIELRANGCYVVAPPSIHPETGAAYRPQSSAQVRELPNMEDVRQWMDAQLARQVAPRALTQKRTMVVGDTSRFAAAALGYECRDIRLTKEGNRAIQLFKSARNIGQLVGDNALPQATAESALLNAALTAGLTEREALATIASGMKKGIAEPRSLQWQRRKSQ